MKLDTQEMETVSAAANVPARFDMYAGIHKALRAAMMDTLLAVGRLDTRDEAEVESVSRRVLRLAEFCTEHLTNENRFVHPAIEARASGSTVRIAHEHVEHVEAIEKLEAAVHHMREQTGQARARAALALYRQLALFVAENFIHMNVEETEHNAVLWAHYSDEELLAINGSIIEQLSPEETIVVMRWMIPAMTPEERLQVLGGMKAKAPKPAFDAVLEAVRPQLDYHAWAKLAIGLGLDPAEHGVNMLLYM